jgi:DNA-binding beta-propeller fold protein YncE
MPLLITSAAGANGDGYGALLAFDGGGRSLGRFSTDSRVADPRGLAVNRNEGLLFLNSGTDRVLALGADGRVVRDTGAIKGLNPGGGNFGPDGRYYVGSRSARTVVAFPTALNANGNNFLPGAIVPFPRGFVFGHDGTLFLASGIGPSREGDNVIIAFSPTERLRHSRLVSDPELSPLDLALGPNGNIVVSSEHPFGSADAVTTVREYDPENGRLVRVFSANRSTKFREPRGLRFGPDSNLYCVARDEVVVFDFASGECLGTAVQFPRLHGQALVFFRSKSQIPRGVWPHPRAAAYP